MDFLLLALAAVAFVVALSIQHGPIGGRLALPCDVYQFLSVSEGFWLRRKANRRIW